MSWTNWPRADPISFGPNEDSKEAIANWQRILDHGSGDRGAYLRFLAPYICIVTRAGIEKRRGRSVRFQDGTLGAINSDSKPFFHRFLLVFHGYEGYENS